MKLKISNRKKDGKDSRYLEIDHYVAEQLLDQDQNGNKKRKLQSLLEQMKMGM